MHTHTHTHIHIQFLDFFVLNCDNLTAFAPICFFDALFTVFFNFSNVFLAAFLKVFFGVFTNFPLLSVPSALPPAGGNHQQAFTVPAGCRHPPSRQGERNMKYTDTEIRNTQIQKYCANKNKLFTSSAGRRQLLFCHCM